MLHSLLTPLFDYQKAIKYLALDGKEAELIKRARAYFNGDHWQEGAGYIGPPIRGGTATQIELKATLQKQFVSENSIEEVVGRQVSALLGQVPSVTVAFRQEREKVPDPSFVPSPETPDLQAPLVDAPLTDEEKALVQEVNQIIKELLNADDAENDPVQVLSRCLEQRLWGRRGYLRVYLSSDVIDKNGNFQQQKSAVDAVKFVFLDQPDLENAQVIIDPKNRKRLGLVHIVVKDSVESKEQKSIEVSWVNDAGQTFIGVLEERKEAVGTKSPIDALFDKAAEQQTEGDIKLEPLLPPFTDTGTALALGGKIPLYELKGKPLVNDQVMSCQAMQNLALTLGVHTIVENGFCEFAVTNVEMEETEIEDPSAPGGKRLVPVPLNRGAGRIHRFQGRPIEDAEGGEKYTEPRVYWKEPSPITTHEGGRQLAREALLSQVHQVHALIAGEETPSGESRRAALWDFSQCTLEIKKEVNRAASWAFEIILDYVAMLIGQPDKYRSLRVVFDCNVFTGNLTSEEQNSITAQVENKLRSRKSARQLLSISDSDGEEAEILRESRLSATLAPPVTKEPTENPQPEKQPPTKD